MAYRRSTRNGYRARGRTTYRAPARRRSTGRSVSRRSSSSRGRGQQTVRIVLETAPHSPVSRNNPFAPVVEAKGNGKAKL